MGPARVQWCWTYTEARNARAGHPNGSRQDTKLIIPSSDDTRHVKKEDEAECATDSGAWSPSWTVSYLRRLLAQTGVRRGPFHGRIFYSRAANPNAQFLYIYRTNYSVASNPRVFSA